MSSPVSNYGSSPTLSEMTVPGWSNPAADTHTSLSDRNRETPGCFKSNKKLLARTLKPVTPSLETTQGTLASELANWLERCEQDNDFAKLRDYLNSPPHLNQVVSMSGEEKSVLTEILLNKNERCTSECLCTWTGVYLLAQQSPDDVYNASVVKAMNCIHHEKPGEFIKFFLSPFPIGLNENIIRSLHGLSEAALAKYRVILQPGWFLDRSGIDHPDMTLIYSEELLELMKQANYSEQEITELLPPCLVKALNIKSVNFFELNESSLLFPELFLSKTFCDFINHCRDFYLKDFNKLLEKIESPEIREKIATCFQVMIHPASNIPVLAELGAELTALLEENNIPIPSDSIADRYAVKNFIAKKRRKLPSQASFLIKTLFAFYRSQNAVYPYLAGHIKGGHFFTKEDTQGILRVAMDRVCERSKSNIRPGSAPVFIGFVPCPIADPVAKKDGFLDSNWSGNFLHGKYSHGMALTTLTRLAGLDREMLGAIINTDCWSRLLDSFAYKNKLSAAPLEKFIDKSNTDHKKGISKPLPDFTLGLFHTLVALNCSPFSYHSQLTTGRLSRSLMDIRQMIELHSGESQTGLLDKLARHMAMDEPLTLEKLKNMTRQITVLEKVIATKHLISIEKITSSYPDLFKTLSDDDLYSPEDLYVDGGYGHFWHNMLNEETRTLARQEKARKYLAKGYTVVGINKHDSIGETVMATDCNRFEAFIAYPPGQTPCTH